MPAAPFPLFSRRSGPLDALLAEADRALRVLSGNATAGQTRPAPKNCPLRCPTRKNATRQG